MRLRISSRLICAGCVRYFDRAYYHRYYVPPCRHRLLFCRSKASRDVFWLLVEFKANRPLNTRGLPCRTYTIPTHSFGVRTNKPSVLYAADYCTYTPLTIAYFLIMTIGRSISWGVAYRYILPAAIGGWSCLSIPISFINWFRDFHST